MLNKRIPDESFDERQDQIRNKIGNQCFFILLISMVIVLQLPTFGIIWATTSIIMTAILLLCSGYFIVRIVWAGAYSGYNTRKSKNVYLTFGLLAIFMAILAAGIKTNLFTESLDFYDGGFLRLLIFLLIFFAIITVSIKVSKYRNDQGDDQ